MLSEKPRPGRKIFYGWVVIAICFISTAIISITRSTFPLFYVAILNEFGWSRAATAIIVSAFGITYGISAPIAGTFFDRFGARKIFPLGAILISAGAFGCSQANQIWQFCLFFGFIGAFGIALVGFGPLVALASNWFVKRRATAVGIAITGMQGSIILSPLVQFLISNIGWRNTYLILGGLIIIIVLPLTQFLRNRPQDMQLLPDGMVESKEEEEIRSSQADSLIIDKEWASTEWILSKAMRTYRFWALPCIMFGLSTTMNLLLTHQVAFMVDIGFSTVFAASLLVLFSVMNIAGRFSGFISDFLGREIAYTIGSVGIILSLVMLIMAKDISDVWMLYAYVILFGFCGGSNAPAYAAAAADMFHGKHFGSIVGFAELGFGLGATLGPWLAGYIFDTTGNYVPAFIVGIVSISLASISLWIAAPRKVRLIARKNPPQP